MIRRTALAVAALGLTTLAARAPADNAPPATGDVLVSVRGGTPGIVLVNALGGQKRIADFGIGAFASSLVYPGDGFLYATLDRDIDDQLDSIVRIDPVTGAVDTLVDQTTSQGQMASPTGLAIDPATGDFIFCQGGQVLRADPTTGAVSVVSQFNLLGSLQEVVVDPTGTYAYVVDDSTDSVVRVALAGGAQKRVVANQPTTVDTILGPFDLVLDGQGIVAVSMINGLTRFDLGSGKGKDVLREPGTGTVAPGAPQGVAIDPAGNFVIIDSNTNTLFRVNPNGTGTVISSGGMIAFPQDAIVVGGAAQSTGGSIGGGGGGGCVLCDLGGTLSGKAKTKLKSVGSDKSDMTVAFAFGAAGTTWTATVDGRQLTGTATQTNKAGTKAVLTPDGPSASLLLEILDERLDAPEPRPMLLVSSAPKLTFKTNKKGTKGLLSVAVKIETDIGSKTYKGGLKAKLKGATGTD